MSYLKLKAKNRLVKNYFSCFCMGALPYAVFILLCILNYYLFTWLKIFDFGELSATVRPALLTASLVLSFIAWRYARLLTAYYFYLKNRNPVVGALKTVRGVGLGGVFTAAMCSILKFFLSVAWGTLYFSPCVIMAGVLYYAVNYEEHNRNLFITLGVCVIFLFALGTAFFYVTLKRYSFTDGIIFSQGEKDSIKAIEKSISLTEGGAVKYSAYCLSFAGWIFSCLLIVPIFYVLPYKIMSRYAFFDWLSGKKYQNVKAQKPIIFYFNKARVE